MINVPSVLRANPPIYCAPKLQAKLNMVRFGCKGNNVILLANT